MFFIKKQFENIISWGIFSFCFFAGFGLFFYSFFIIYPLDQISEAEDQNILDIGANINVISKPFDFSKVKINVNTEKEFQKNTETKKQKNMETLEQENNKSQSHSFGAIKQENNLVGANGIRPENKKTPEKKIESEIGMASWYCPKWCGKLAAAHPKYSKGTKLKVTNLENKKSVTVIVNDFGPIKSIHPDRIIDLTKTAFQKIANPNIGTIKVRVEKL